MDADEQGAGAGAGDRPDLGEDLPEVIEDDPAPPEPWSWAQRLLLAAFVALIVVANLGSIIAPHLQKTSPAGLLAMSSRNRHLLLAIGNHISLRAYVVVASARLMAAALVCYGLGRVFGDRALRWFTRFLGIPRTSIDQLEARFETLSWGLVPFMCGSNIDVEGYTKYLARGESLSDR